MSVTSVTSHAIWGSAANALGTPSAPLVGFKTASHTAPMPPPSQHVSDAMQGQLAGLQGNPRQSGAFATDIMQALSAYGHGA